MEFHKLVRDKIPDIIRRKGELPLVRVAGDDEYWQKLKEKLEEEVAEFLEAENEEEMADIIEVLRAICIHRGIDLKRLEEIRRKKAEERGAFLGRVILEETR